jgi:DNA-binding XRE family transcriptional regulator
MGWTQAEFALVAGVSVRTIKDIERNRVDPKTSTMRRVSAVLHHHGIKLLRDGSGAVGVTCPERERKIIEMRRAG